MNAHQTTARRPDYGVPHLIVELTNICNLHCSYCLRDEDALYHTPANFLSVELLRRILDEAREAMAIEHVSFTGGEPALHPRFREVIETVESAGLRTSFVTNGWHFDRIWPVIDAHRSTVAGIAFSLDGATREAHDRWRGDGSFVRLVRAFARCHMSDFPFVVKVGLRRDTFPQIEQLVLFTARMGASAIQFWHLLPTSTGFDRESALTADERTFAEEEIASLGRIFKMDVKLDVGYYNIDPAPPCVALAGVSCNVDFRGNLSLCCNLSGFRGAPGAQEDVVANLNETDFATALRSLRRVAARQMERRQAVLDEFKSRGERPDLYVGSPCLLCLQHFGKIPWHTDQIAGSRLLSLPVLNSV